MTSGAESATAALCGCVRRLRARAAPAAALLLVTSLLLMLTRPDPPQAPREPPAPIPANTATPQLYNSWNPADLTALPLPVDNWVSDVVDEVLPAGAVRVRERYVPGHARAQAELCPARGAQLRLIVLVASAPAHVRQRQAVRLTWGHAAQRADVALGFMLGTPPPALRAALDSEEALYGDLIEGHYVDSYGNLTLKTLSMLEWFVTHCPQAARLLKSDDDMFINVEGLLRFVEAPERRSAVRTVWGKVWRTARPDRNVSSKFFVPSEEFPGAVYPAYVNGPAYLVSGDAPGVLLHAALGARWLHMEDVLVTGVAAARAQVTRVHAPAFLRRTWQVGSACTMRAALAVHKVPYHDQFELWRKLNDPTTKC